MGASHFIPKDFCRVEFFQAREVFQKTAAGGWELSGEHSTPTLREQLDAWLTKTRHVVCSASPPTTDVFYLDDAQTLRCFLTGVSVCYIAATEGAASPRHESTTATKSEPAVLGRPEGLKWPGPQVGQFPPRIAAGGPRVFGTTTSGS